ncbi:MAG: aromatic ring-hydroxylating dioxygenase subunit alpha [Albidovulum sp.]|nr:aromatic ring-hydroxylating dioxygenase subunit alpha [Albidovulum sp.]
MSVPIIRLGENDFPFTSDAAESFTLPSKFYFGADIFEREKDAIFYKCWLYAGHASQVSRPGSYLTTRIHDQNVFVIRNASGRLNGFYNVCQHRGHELVNGTGRTNIITCPYHAWAYDFDGNLRRARNAENVKGFAAREFSLKRVRVEEFCGMVFVNLDSDAVPFSEQVPGLEEDIRRYSPELEKLEFAQRDAYSVAANWKVLIDNFLECYHCETAHKDFVNLVDMKSYRSKICGIYSRHCSGKARTTESTAYKFEQGDVEFGYAGWFVWPNLTIWAYPGDPNISTLQMIPEEAERTIEYQDWFVPGGKPTRQLRDAMDYQRSILQPEDISLCEKVQKGLKSKGYNQGRFIVDSDRSELSEHAVHHFQHLVARALGEEC